jgi:hypothetical protein
MKPKLGCDWSEAGGFQPRKPTAMEKAMGQRENPLHPMFRGHNCAYCRDGALPCKQGTPNQCGYPHARND